MNKIWENQCDNRFDVSVDQDTYSSGTLKVVDSTTGTEIHSEHVSVSYGAKYGPDVSDVSDWQDKGCAAIDTFLASDLDRQKPE